METLMAVVFLAVAGERLAEWLLKPFTERIPWPEGWGDYGEMLVCALPGVAFGLLARLDAFAAIGISFYPAVAGVIITSIFIGGGANLVHIFVDAVETKTLKDEWDTYVASGEIE